MIQQEDRYVRKANSSHSLEEYSRRLGEIFYLENKNRNIDFDIQRLKDGKAQRNYYLKQLRTELAWGTGGKGGVDGQVHDSM